MTREQRRNYARKRRRMKQLYSQFMRAGELVFDVGANVGSRTEIFSALGAQVIAVEPQKECLRVLYIRFHENPRVTIIPKALGAHAAQMELQLASHSQLATLNQDFARAMSPHLSYQNVTWKERRLVNVTTLDALIEQFGVPTFIKIDVEGFEHQVLAGLAQPIPACAFEFQPHYLEAAQQSIARLEQLGGARYNYYLVEEMKLRLDEWVSAEEMQAILKSFEHTDAFPIGEVYARLSVPSERKAAHAQ